MSNIRQWNEVRFHHLPSGQTYFYDVQAFNYTDAVKKAKALATIDGVDILLCEYEVRLVKVEVYPSK